MPVVLLPARSFSTLHAPEVLLVSTWANRLRDCLVVVLAKERFTNDYQKL